MRVAKTGITAYKSLSATLLPALVSQIDTQQVADGDISRQIGSSEETVNHSRVRYHCLVASLAGGQTNWTR